MAVSFVRQFGRTQSPVDSTPAQNLRAVGGEDNRVDCDSGSNPLQK
jgi:hypothetical protein